MLREAKRRPTDGGNHVKAIAAVLACSLILTMGGAAHAQTAARTQIVVAPIASTDMTAVYWAKDQGLFEKAGLDVTIQQTPTGAASMQAVIGGAAQVGYGNTLALSTAHGKGIAVALICPGAQYRTNLPHAVLLAAADSPAKTPKDVEGKTVAVAGLHDLLGISVVTWMNANGVDPTKVNFVEMPPATMQAALQAKRVDFAASYEPFLSASVKSGVARVFAKPYDAIGNNFLTGAWFVMEPWAAQHKEATLAFARVLDQAAQYVNGHYDDLIPLISQVSKLPPETLQNMVHLYTPPKLDASAIQLVVNAAYKAKEIPAQFNAADMLLPGAP